MLIEIIKINPVLIKLIEALIQLIEGPPDLNISQTNKQTANNELLAWKLSHVVFCNLS